MADHDIASAFRSCPRRPRIVVIGGGFCGTVFVMHLLRAAPGLLAEISIVEPRGSLGEGLAYGTRDPEHRVNVAAARMSLFAETPGDFHEWFVATHGDRDDPASVVESVGVYPRRAAFAGYVRTRLCEARQHAQAEVHHVHARALSAQPLANGFTVTMEDGRRLNADWLILATGHPATEPPAPLRALAGDPALIDNPWSAEALRAIDADERVVVVGTGLTMGDVLATLRTQGHRAPALAISRRGLLPRPRTVVPVEPTGDFTDPPERCASALLARVRRAIAVRVAAGRPWEDVFDALRAQGRAVWSALPVADRLRLLRHAAPFWDVHRYQCAPQIHARLRGDLASGALIVRAASLRGAERGEDGIRLRLHARGAPAEEEFIHNCDRVITCTGPGHRSAIARNRLLKSLAEAGSIRADGFGLGIEVDDRAQAIGADGRAQERLLVVGPPARGTWGELMGLPQVSAQPREVAVNLAHSLSDQSFLQEQLPA
jgi:uncharacterized NAD(P)/FAD-binding protein YdhS